MLPNFILDPRLDADCHKLVHHNHCHILLMDNALYPWLILVPETKEIELIDLKPGEQQNILETINLISRFIQNEFKVEKLNTAMIGNIVQQLHIHIIGRHSNDTAWPNTVWGRKEKEYYEQSQVENIKRTLHTYLSQQT